MRVYCVMLVGVDTITLLGTFRQNGTAMKYGRSIELQPGERIKIMSSVVDSPKDMVLCHMFGQ